MTRPSRAAVPADRHVPDPRMLRGVRHLALAGLAAHSLLDEEKELAHYRWWT